MTDLLSFLLVVLLLIQAYYLVRISYALNAQRVITPDISTGVSIIIAARNEERNLGELLERINSQNHQNIEVIVVCDRCTDNTANVARENSRSNTKVIEIEKLDEGKDGKKNAISVGIAAASNELLLLTDADCRPESNDWVAAMAGSVNNYDILIGPCPISKGKGLLGYFIQYENFITHFLMFGFAAMGRPFMGIGRNLMYKKSLFINSGGFSGIEKLTGGDDDLLVNKWSSSKSIGWILDPDTRVFTNGKDSVSSYAKQKIRHLKAGKRYRLSHKFMLAVYFSSLVLFWPIMFGLFFTGISPFVLGCAILARYLFMVPVFWESKVLFGNKFKIHYLPILDFIYGLYYISGAIATIVVKKTTWT